MRPDNVSMWEVLSMTDEEINGRCWISDGVNGDGRLVSPARYRMIRAWRSVVIFYLGERLRWTAKLNKVLSALDARYK